MIVDMIVEIPFNSSIKYEFDEKANKMRCDRVLHTAMSYPGNYGFIPNTKAGDGDPLDILLISDYSIYPGTIIQAKIIGALDTEDEKGKDEKILAVPAKSVDPSFKDINDVWDLHSYTLTKIRHFFEHYKDAEKNKWVKVGEFVPLKPAIEIYQSFRIPKKLL